MDTKMRGYMWHVYINIICVCKYILLMWRCEIGGIWKMEKWMDKSRHCRVEWYGMEYGVVWSGMKWYEVVWSRNCKHIKSNPSCHKTFSLSCQRIASLWVCDLCCRQVTNYDLNDLNCNFLMKKPRIAMLDGNCFAALGKEKTRAIVSRA